MDEKKLAIIKKIEKIMVQANDQEGTPEGDIFKKKAALMMAKYRIEESELDLEFSNLIKDNLEFYADGDAIPQWVDNVISSFSWCFDTQTIYRTHSYENPIRREWDVVGTFSDVETTIYFSEVVLNHIETAGWKAWPNPRHWKKRNQLGNVACQVIWDRVYALKSEMDVTMHADEHCTSLVVSKKEMIAEGIKEAYPNLSHAPIDQKDMPSDAKTINAGMEAGKTAPMNFAIE
jgi:hypothetical protein